MISRIGQDKATSFKYVMGEACEKRYFIHQCHYIVIKQRHTPLYLMRRFQQNKSSTVFNIIHRITRISISKPLDS